MRPRLIGPPSDPPNWFRSKRCGSCGRELEEVPRIERVVPQELEHLAAKLVGARSGDDVDDRARDVTVLGAERRVVDLEFLDAGEGGSNISEPNVRLLVVTPLTRNPTASSRLPAVLKASAPTPRIGLDGEPGLRWRHRPGHEQTEIGEVAAVERNLLHRLRRDDMADGGRRAIDERHFRANDHRLGCVADGQAEVAHQRPADVDGQRLDDARCEIRSPPP